MTHYILTEEGAKVFTSMEQGDEVFSGILEHHSDNVYPWFMLDRINPTHLSATSNRWLCTDDITPIKFNKEYVELVDHVDTHICMTIAKGDKFIKTTKFVDDENEAFWLLAKGEYDGFVRVLKD